MDGLMLLHYVMNWVDKNVSGLFNKLFESNLNPLNTKFFKPAEEITKETKMFAEFYRRNADAYENALKHRGIEIHI